MSNHMLRITFSDGSIEYFTVSEAAAVQELYGPMVDAVTVAHRREDFDEEVELSNLGRVVNRYGVTVS